MARAKRTDRAEARRRYRARLAAEEGESTTPESTDETAAATGAESRAAQAPGASRAAGPRRSSGPSRPGGRGGGAGPDVRGGPERPPYAGGLRNAFRLAFRPLTLREDLVLLPRLLQNKAFWLPIVLAGAMAVLVLALQGRELITRFAAYYFIGGVSLFEDQLQIAPPIGGMFLAGFLAPRASYLLGILYGIVSAGLLGVIAPYVSEPVVPASFELVLSAASSFALSGIFFSGMAAWYRRFLYLASPARQAPQRRPPPAASSRGKPASSR